MRRPRFNPYRCMRGGFKAVTPTNLGTVGLYNNSTGPEMIAIWSATINTAASAVNWCTIIKGLQGAARGSINPLITDEVVHAGQVTYLDTATNITPDYADGAGFDFNFGQTARWPFAILQPGWSFVIQDQTGADAISAGFIWQSCHPEDLRGGHCDLCDGPIVVVVTT